MREAKFGIAAEFDLLVVDANRTEIFGEAFVEPSLGGRIVEVQQHSGEVVRDGAPGFLFEEVEDDEVLIVAGEEESGDVDGLALAQGSELVIGLVVLEGENGQGDGLVEVFFAQQRGEDGAHLLEAEGDFAAFLFASVGDDGEVGGVDLEPRGFGGKRARAQRQGQNSGAKGQSEYVREGESSVSWSVH